MKPVLVSVLSLACFGLGWSVDTWVSAQPESRPVSRFLSPEPASKQSAAPAPAVLQAQTRDPAGSRSSSSIRSLDDLLKLVVQNRPNQTQARLGEALAHLSAAELASLARQFKERVIREPRSAWPPPAVALAIANYWLRVDPAAAATFIFDSRFPGATGDFAGPFYEAMQKLVRTDLPTVRRLMAGMNDRDIYIMTRLEYVDSLAGADPAVALPLIVDFELKTRNETQSATNYRDFPADWIRKDPVTAMKWALALPPGHIREILVHSMAKTWAEADAPAAQAFYREMSSAGLPYGLRRMLKERMDKDLQPAGGRKAQGQ